MLVCVCKAVSDRDIARAVANGARTVEDLGRCTGAGTDCGSCRESLACAVQGPCPGSARPDRVHLALAPLGPLAIPA